MQRGPVSERAVIFVIGAVQFVNILDFMMVAPLGPDFSRALGIPMSQLAYIVGAYTASAAFAGLAGSFFLDRFDRKSALVVSLCGLATGTVLGGAATGLYTLMAARFVAGVFGGPATSLALSIVADVVPNERRGKAMGAVMGAFSVASVVGVPLGLRLALWGGWRAPFWVVGAGGFLAAIAAWVALPSIRGHLDVPKGARVTFGALARRREVLLSWAMTGTVMMAGFIILPNLSTHLQENLGYPRASLGTLYLLGGMLSFVSMRVGGWMVDRFGSFLTGGAAVAAIEVTLFLGFVHYLPQVPVALLFTLFMGALALRNVAYNTLTSKVPSTFERARFMSIQSAVQHLASASGAFLSVQLLSVRADGTVAGMDRIAWISMALMAAIPVFLRVVERRVKGAAARAGPVPPQEPQSGISAPHAPPARRS